MNLKQLFSQHRRLFILIGFMLAIFASMTYAYFRDSQVTAPAQKEVVKSISDAKKPVEPTIVTEDILEGLAHPWDIVFLPDNTMLVNERNGVISKLEAKQKKEIAKIEDVYAVGEGGLTGMTIDANFTENSFIYTCFNARTASGIDVRLSRWKLVDDQLTERTDIVTDIPSNISGRHSGCRVRSGKTGDLWVGTGDAARASNPQDPKNLGGKILHITRDGMPAGNNLPAPFDPRVFSFGHRNVQGLVLFNKPKNNIYGYSVEHGSDKDDEVNLLKSGNFGWAPQVTYVEAGVPMTDLARFPDAVTAIWSSGSPTIAPSGAFQLKGENWGTWNGAVAVAVLKAKQVKLFWFDESNKLIREESILTNFGRIRSLMQDNNGNLYLSTDNGTNDKIIKITPSQN